jgi:lipopolysaccharide export system permease protein
MFLLNRYIGRTVIKATGVIVLIVAGMNLFVSFAREFNNVGDGNYSVWRAMMFVPMNLPYDIYHIFPVIGLIGGIIGLGLLASRSELIVMRTSGVSVFQICWAVMRSALLLVVVVTILGETLAPRLEYLGERMRARAQYSNKAIVTLHGLWMRDHHKFIHVKTVVNRRQLHEVTVYQYSDDLALQYAERAKELRFVEGKWLAFDIAKTEFFPDHTKTTHIAKKTWNLKLDSRLLNLELNEPGDMTLNQLYHYIQYRKSNGLHASVYQLAFWQRIFQPLAVIIMILLAVPFVFGSLRTGTMGWRITVGLVFGLLFYLLDQLIGQLSLVYRLSPILGALFPLILFAGIGVFMMRRVR